MATGAAAVVAAVSGPAAVVYALAVLSTIAATLFRPAHSALLPSLCRTGHELASANMVRGLLDSAATLVGPLLAAAASARSSRRSLTGLFGVRWALIGIGLVCPVLAVASWRQLRRLDGSVGALDREIALLQQVPMLRTLPLPSIEQLARGLEPVAVAGGGGGVPTRATWATATT